MSEIARSHWPTDYEEYAPTYAWARFAVPWVLQPLAALVSELPEPAVLEIGCGTGNYVRALAEAHSNGAFTGLDLSPAMLREARSFRPSVALVCGDASTAFPFADRTFQMAFAVDVIHHIEDVSRFFSEAGRVLSPNGQLVIVTDSEDTLRRRSLTKFFPEIFPIELARYPRIQHLQEEAKQTGLEPSGHEQVSGYNALGEPFIHGLASKCSSAMRLITSAEHAQEIGRAHV